MSTVPGVNEAYASAQIRHWMAILQGEELTFEQLLVDMHAGTVPVIDLKAKTLRSDNKRHSSITFLVWRSSPSGCLVRSGHIAFPRRSILFLDGHGANFHGITFSGIRYPNFSFPIPRRLILVPPMTTSAGNPLTASIAARLEYCHFSSCLGCHLWWCFAVVTTPESGNWMLRINQQLPTLLAYSTRPSSMRPMTSGRLHS